jgi:hypothetical protein
MEQRNNKVHELNWCNGTFWNNKADGATRAYGTNGIDLRSNQATGHGATVLD